MAEFINKELAMSAECATWATGKYAKENANEHFIRGIETYKEWLKNLPTADVAEVKHGYWVDGVCTNCGVKKPIITAYRGFSDVVYQYQGELNYCPNCGAKMDGGK